MEIPNLLTIVEHRYLIKFFPIITNHIDPWIMKYNIEHKNFVGSDKLLNNIAGHQSLHVVSMYTPSGSVILVSITIQQKKSDESWHTYHWIGGKTPLILKMIPNLYHNETQSKYICTFAASAWHERVCYSWTEIWVSILEFHFWYNYWWWWRW